MTGYVRQSAADIIPGSVVRANPINAEFNQLASAFSGATGHAHDGTTGNGPKLALTASVSGILPIANGGTNAATAAAARTNLGLAIGTNVQAWSDELDSISSFSDVSGFGLARRYANGQWGTTTITGTANEITVTNGGGILAVPTISLPSAMTMTGKTLTGGTYISGLFAGQFTGPLTSSLVTITGGTLSNVTITSSTLSGSGAGITSLTAANLTGTISDAVHGNRAGGTLHAAATTSVNGFMSAADKTKLDSIIGAGSTNPTGTILMYGGNAAPAGHAECNGQALNRASNAALFAVLGTTYGPGDGVTTFNIPDMRGMFARGWDHGRMVDPARTLGSTQVFGVESHNHAASTGSSGSHTHTGTTTSYNHSHGGAVTDLQGLHSHQYNRPVSTGDNDRGSSSSTWSIDATEAAATAGDGIHGHNVTIPNDNHNHTFTTSSDGAHTHTVTVNANGIAETRPWNVTVMYIIKT